MALEKIRFLSRISITLDADGEVTHADLQHTDAILEDGAEAAPPSKSVETIRDEDLAPLLRVLKPFMASLTKEATGSADRVTAKRSEARAEASEHIRRNAARMIADTEAKRKRRRE